MIRNIRKITELYKNTSTIYLLFTIEKKISGDMLFIFQIMICSVLIDWFVICCIIKLLNEFRIVKSYIYIYISVFIDWFVICCIVKLFNEFRIVK